MTRLRVGCSPGGWARSIGNMPVTLTNSYDGFGDLTREDYNDGTPSVLFNNYNRAAEPREIVDGGGTTELAYDYACRLTSATGVGGVYNGITVSNHYDPVYGRDKLITTNLSSTLETDYGYDIYGRMASVSSGGDTAAYGYLPNSDLLETTTSSHGGSPVLTITRQWDYGFRLRSIANVANGLTVTSHAYTYDTLNRRTQALLEDGSYWNYSYNDRNEATVANRYWPDSTAVAGQQYGYGFDNIGNRTNALSGSAGSLRQTTYWANSLNEYSSVTTPGYKDIMGLAVTSNTVTVNGGNADRKGEYFHKEISVSNGSGPAWQEVTNSVGGTTITGGLTFPASSQTMTYDADGNLTFDGIWNYAWDAENRLISMNMTNNIAGLVPTNRLKLDFAYDYMNRRVSKIVSTNSSGNNFVPQSTNHFIYDGWNLIASLIPTGTIQQSFVWGLDLSGTMTSAGGIGGLLAIAASGTNYFASYDGNGNITGLTSGTEKSTDARYEYSPFGELIRASGPMAKANPFRFSTKFRDDESGLVYYGYRYYSPTIGRWLGRDSSQEKGGMNLFCFANNNAVRYQDPLGNDLFDTAEQLAQMASQELANYRPGSTEWLMVYGTTQTLFSQMLKGAMVYSGPISIVKGIIGGTTTVAEAYEVDPTSTVLGVGGALVGSALIGAGVGYAAFSLGQAVGELGGVAVALGNFQAAATVDYWADPNSKDNSAMDSTAVAGY